MAIDWNKVDEVTLALLTLTSFKEGGVTRSWKGHDWDVMNRLHQKGWISDPVSKAKSVVLSDGVPAAGPDFDPENFGNR